MYVRLCLSEEGSLTLRRQGGRRGQQRAHAQHGFRRDSASSAFGSASTRMLSQAPPLIRDSSFSQLVMCGPEIGEISPEAVGQSVDMDVCP
jgi:hypothetical protein